MEIQNRKNKAIRWSIYAAVILVSYIIQFTPNSFLLFGAKPFLLAIAVSIISVYEEPLPSVAFAAVAGMLWDVGSGRPFGFNGILLVLVCLATSLLTVHILQQNIISAIICGIGAVTVSRILDFFFFAVIWDQPDLSAIFTESYLYNLLISYLIIPIVFMVIRPVAKRFENVSDV